MISVKQAINTIENESKPLSGELINVKHSIGHCLNQDIISEIDMPPFNQSAMDGYALNYDSYLNTYRVIGEIKAGDDCSRFILQKGECIRIFTGAAVPKSATTIIQQEWCNNKNNVLSFNKKIKDSLNIRNKGEQIRQGDTILNKNHLINPASIGLISTVGINNINIIRKAKVAIVITGDELIKTTDEIKEGSIFESNSSMLCGALNKYGYDNINIYFTKDTRQDTESAISQAIKENDLILVSGGISVGDYDFVKFAFDKLNVKKQFYKINQKPGKPMFFGTKDDKYIFGLPGNPGASLTCFYIYVLRCLSIISKKEYPLSQIKVKLTSAYIKKSSRSEFIKANVKNNQAEICSHQSSAMLLSFAKANALVFIDESVSEVSNKDDLDAYLLL